MDKLNELIRLWNRPPSLLQLPTRHWSKLLPLAEFAYNNTLSATTALHPLVNKGFIWTAWFIQSMTLHPPCSWLCHRSDSLPLLDKTFLMLNSIPNFHWFHDSGSGIQDWKPIYVKAQYFCYDMTFQELSINSLSVWNLAPGTHSVTLWFWTVSALYTQSSTSQWRNQQLKSNSRSSQPTRNHCWWRTGIQNLRILNSKMTLMSCLQLLYLVFGRVWGTTKKLPGSSLPNSDMLLNSLWIFHSAYPAKSLVLCPNLWLRVHFTSIWSLIEVSQFYKSKQSIYYSL